MGILNLCALVGSLTAGKTSDVIGRRYTIALSSVIFLVGSVVMGYGPNYAVLMVGRCIAGVGVGFALMIAPVYSAEIASASHRGFLTSLPELCISLGILLGYVSNYCFGKLALKLGWRLMLGLAAIPSMILAFGILKMPESPRWLVMQGRLEEAKKIMVLISNTEEEAEERFRDILAAAEIEEDGAVKAVGRACMERAGDNPTPAHATGIEAVVLYSPKIFEKAGVTSKDKLLLATVGVGLTKAVLIVIATFLLDKVGRRKLLLTSTGGMVFASTSLAIGLTMVHRFGRLVWALRLSIVSAYTFVAFFSIGLGPITWVYSSEIFPLRLRAQGASIGVATITMGGVFFMFAGIAVVAWWFFFFMLPETKGVPLEEIEKLFGGGDARGARDGLEIQAKRVNNKI
ncbi:probable polyol transporter 3 [Brassica napus]|uniref:probable polyol transporter 3 n=1 Tax=Brassica napus TaxID=3708 RepID=UPI00207A9949|nr:probable polyol transporter 3 [Brassica napus]